ncbi:MAG: hypothetical protein J6P21_03695 [Clostridia bacterium]|nr:hypothetical protein [Clostridia bacterium]
MNFKNNSEPDLQLLAYKLMPEIKKFFADKKIQKEFQEWLKVRNREEEFTKNEKSQTSNYQKAVS